jgi:hypothetical protein
VQRKPLLALAVLAAVALAVGLALRGRPAEGPERGHGVGPVASDVQDDRVVDYVYDSLVVQVALDAARRCPMPSRKVSGILKVRTQEGQVVLDEWRWKTPPPGWPEESQRCAEAAFKGVIGQPPTFKVPPGREYELDVELTFPPPPADPR